MKVTVAYFEITNACNLNCTTCYNRSGLNKECVEISFNQLRRSIDILLPLGLQRVLISGGEPTLHTEFESILDLIHEYPELSFGVVTNGTVHNRKLIDTLNSNDRLTLQVSLDGSCEELNAKTRGVGNFDKTIAFATQILYRGNTKPLMKMVLSQNNIDDAESFYRLAVSHGFLPEYAFIFKYGNGCDDWENKALSAQQKLNILCLVDRLNGELQTEAPLPFCTDKCPYVKDAEAMSVCIKVDGSIQPCQMLYDSTYSLGNIFDFDVITFEHKTNAFVELARKRTQCDYGCDKCPLKETCGKGCLAAAVNLCSDPLADDGECEFRVKQFFGYDLEKQKGLL